MPDYAYMYPIDYKYYEKYRVRRYGFHGSSHFFVSNRAAEMLGKDIKDLKIVTCHLGNGCSMAAVDGGKSIDTTMGVTPLEGVMMGTRSGDVDPGVIFTGGIGENVGEIRERSVEGLEFMGVKMNKELNNTICGSEAVVSTDDSKVKVMVIPTNEELVLARDSKKLYEEKFGKK